MSSISPSNSGTGLARYAPARIGGSGIASPIRAVAQATPREQELIQQLDDRLTKHISLIRQHIALQHNASSDNTEDKGTRLDILA